MNFEEYLTSKKIDSAAFRLAEPHLWERWRKEFEQLHPNSFTVQKLNLINPIRRKYLLKTQDAVSKLPGENTVSQEIKPVEEKPAAKPAMPKPVFKPKPKI